MVKFEIIFCQKPQYSFPFKYTMPASTFLAWIPKSFPLELAKYPVLIHLLPCLSGVLIISSSFPIISSPSTTELNPTPDQTPFLKKVSRHSVATDILFFEFCNLCKFQKLDMSVVCKALIIFLPNTLFIIAGVNGISFL